jgi:hypothetical protein
VVVSFIGRGNRSTCGKPPTCRKSLTGTHIRAEIQKKEKQIFDIKLEKLGYGFLGVKYKIKYILITFKS